MGEARRRKVIEAFQARARQYADDCGIAVDIAARRLKVFDYYGQLEHKAKRCPRCGKYALYIETTDYEFAHNESWVTCGSCEFDTDVTAEYEPLQHWFDFDAVMALKGEIDDWTAFALKDTAEIEADMLRRNKAV